MDLETVLFLDKGKRPLGRVFDVIGPVSLPLYCVRFNSKDHIANHHVEKGTEVYAAPNTQHTSYVFIQQLLNMKGTDASWKVSFITSLPHILIRLLRTIKNMYEMDE